MASFRIGELATFPPRPVASRATVHGDAGFAAELFSGTRRAEGSGFLLVLALLLAATELGVATRTH